MNIAFIGLGNMGGGMCANLVKAGHTVAAFDLNADAVKAVAAKGARAAASVADAVKDAEVVVSMLPAGKHVLGVYFGPDCVKDHAKRGTLLILSGVQPGPGRVLKRMGFLGSLHRKPNIEDRQIRVLELDSLFSVRERPVPDRQQLLLIEQ